MDSPNIWKNRFYDIFQNNIIIDKNHGIFLWKYGKYGTLEKSKLVVTFKLYLNASSIFLEQTSFIPLKFESFKNTYRENKKVLGN